MNDEEDLKRKDINKKRDDEEDLKRKDRNKKRDDDEDDDEGGGIFDTISEFVSKILGK